MLPRKKARARSRWLSLVSLFLLAFSVPCLGAAPASKEKIPAHIRISFGPLTRMTDGSVTQHYQIITPGLAAPADRLDLSAVYRITARTGRTKGYYPAPVRYQTGGPCLSINSKTNVRVDLWVFGTLGSSSFTAQACHFLFGKAKEGPPDLPPNTLRLKNQIMEQPALTLDPKARLYYLQTGVPYGFTYQGRGRSPGPAMVLEERQIKAAIPMEPSLIQPSHSFTYTAPHDPQLDRAGPHATKEVVFLVPASLEGRVNTTTLTLALHRSIRGHARMGAGLLLFGASFALTLALTLINKKRPWYR